jgi:hypothetical protein
MARIPPPLRRYHLLNYCYYYRVAPRLSLTVLLRVVPCGDIRQQSDGFWLRGSCTQSLCEVQTYSAEAPVIFRTLCSQ